MTSSFRSEISAPAWLTTTPIAHRGLHVLPETPENSLIAFDAASAAGYPAELDVRLLADGEVAVFHDSTLDRMTGLSGPLSACSADELGDLRLLETGQTIPLLRDVLALISGRTPLLIEIKSEKYETVGPLEDALLRLLAAYDGAFALQSFRTETVNYLKKAAPSYCVGQLASDDAWADGISFTGNGVSSPDFLAYSVNAVPTPLTSDLHGSRGVPLLVWTVANQEGIAKANDVADNFIFDHIRPSLPKLPHAAL